MPQYYFPYRPKEADMDKIKAFFDSKVVKVVSWILTGLGITSLFISGVGIVDVNEFAEMILKGISLVTALIAFITERCGKK